MSEPLARLRAALAPLPAHRACLDGVLSAASEDARVLALLAAGSLADGRADAWSDLDLVAVLEPAAWEEMPAIRLALARGAGAPLAAFTGEHVGEPRLLIALVGPPLVHVDIKCVLPDDLVERVDEPLVLWCRDPAAVAALARSDAAYPRPDDAWIEARFWTWIHYAATKLGRGELFEALDLLAFLRARVLGPLALEASGATPSGVRRLETAAPGWAARLRATVAAHDPASIGLALEATVAAYRALRQARGRVAPGDARAELEAVRYLAAVCGREAPGG